MPQKSQNEVIDNFAAAICAVAGVDDPAARAAINRATGDLIENLSSQATNLAAHEVLRMIHQMIAIEVGMADDEDRITRLELRTERRNSTREDG